jgi:hypothetical protein
VSLHRQPHSSSTLYLTPAPLLATHCPMAVLTRVLPRQAGTVGTLARTRWPLGDQGTNAVIGRGALADGACRGSAIALVRKG